MGIRIGDERNRCTVLRQLSAWGTRGQLRAAGLNGISVHGQKCHGTHKKVESNALGGTQDAKQNPIYMQHSVVVRAAGDGEGSRQKEHAPRYRANQKKKRDADGNPLNHRHCRSARVADNDVSTALRRAAVLNTCSWPTCNQPPNESARPNPHRTDRRAPTP